MISSGALNWLWVLIRVHGWADKVRLFVGE
jgi:hypothetical protein